MTRYLANCSMLFSELDSLERPAAARDAGFGAVEFWWPFSEAAPGDREIERFVGAIRDSGVQLVGLNLFAGDLVGPDCGVLSIPTRLAEFRASVDIAIEIGGMLGVRVFNALYGNRVDGFSAEEQDALAQENIAYAATAAAAIGADILIEPISSPKPYPLRTAGDAVRVIEDARRSGVENIGLLFDLFHLAANGEDLDTAMTDHIGTILHVQIADFPGRGEPGSGGLDLRRYLRRLDESGYEGWVGLEYKPTVSTLASFSWLSDWDADTTFGELEGGIA